MALAEVGDSAEVVMQSGGGGAGRRHQRHWTAAAHLYALQGVLQAVDAYPLELVHLKLAQRILAQAEDRYGAPDRVVHRRRREHSKIGWNAPRPRVRSHACAGSQQGGEVGERAAVGEHAGARVRTPPDLLEHPLEHHELDGGGCGSHLVDRRRVIDRAVNQVGQRRGYVRARHLMCE